MNSYYNSPEDRDAEGATNRSAEEPGAEGLDYSGKDLDVYHVLLALERGELSVEDAARRLEELETASPREANGGSI